MKTLLVPALLLFILFGSPTISYAGGSSHDNNEDKKVEEKTDCNVHDEPSKSKEDIPIPVPLQSTVTPTPAPTPTPTPTPSPTPVPTPSGGGGMIPCTGPLSYGWHVDIPGGGCANGTKTISTSTPAPIPTPISVIHLNDMPYTGYTLSDLIKDLIGTFYIF